MAGISGAEWEQPVLCGKRDFAVFENWLDSLIKHWRDKPSNNIDTSDKDIVLLSYLLRPNFEVVLPLHEVAGMAEQKIISLEDNQYRLLDAVEENIRVLCSGAAGTGKTLLAKELARRWTSRGLSVLLVCHSPWLKRYLDGFAIAGLSVATVDGAELALRRSGIQCFDALIVDEGQDIMNFEDLDRLGKVLKGGIETGQWCIFHDKNNQVGVLGDFDPEAYLLLKSVATTTVPLKVNCRNTSQILNAIKSKLHVDMGTDSVGDGPSVEYRAVRDASEAAQELQLILNDLTQNDEFSVNEIVVLSPRPLKDSCANALCAGEPIHVEQLDSFSPVSSRTGVGFAQIADYKGLESPAVVLVDIPNDYTNPALNPLQYVGMSRARVLLYVIQDESLTY
jgi:hypothetical protein